MNTSSRKYRALLVGAGALGILWLAGPTRADVAGDLRGGVYTDVGNGFVGGGVLTGVSRNLDFNPNLEVVLVDGYNYMTGNADFHYDLSTAGNTAAWLGGGVALIVVDYDWPRNWRSDTDVGLNVFGGVGARRGSVRPYVQMKGLIANNSEASLAVGIRF